MRRALAWTLALAAGAAPAAAALRLPALFSNHMVLQGGRDVAVWGWADPGVRVQVEFADRTGHPLARAAGAADAAGKWRCLLPAMAGGSVGTLRLRASDGEEMRVADVAIGEVWLGGGQSNMSYQIHGYNTPASVVARAQAEAEELRPSIRTFTVAWNSAETPQGDVAGSWTVASSENVGLCSALAWNFGVALQRKLHRPIGLIISAYGGTPVEAWIPQPELDATSVAPAIWRRHREALSHYRPEQDVRFQAAYAAWVTANPGDLRDIHTSSRPPEPYSPTNRNVPVRLYNGMVRGLEPYTVSGVIWFQADGNQHRASEYPELIRALVQAWRGHWGEELPFYYVELNNMYAPQQKPVEDRLTLIRDAQNAMLTLPRTDVVTAIDLGVSLTAHFPDKQPLGRRLANLVLAESYHLPSGEVHSPEFAGYTVEGRRVRLHFRHAGGLRTRAGGPLRGFAIRGPAGDWLWAEGRIVGEEILVWNEHLDQPAAVRYAWASNPIISVENSAGLPLRPFRTDTGW